MSGRVGVTAVALLAGLVAAAPVSAFRLAGEPAGLRKWFAVDLPAPFVISSLYDEPGIGGNGERNEVRAGFAEWQAYPADIEVEFDDQGLTTGAGFGLDGANIVTFADPFDDLAPGLLALTRTWYSTIEIEETNGREFHRILEVDIVFAEDHPFVDHAGAGPSCVGAADLRAVTAHEVGHFIGLGHSEFVPSTMYAVVSNCDPGRADLDADDVAGGHFVYPPEQRRDILRAFVGDLATPIGSLFPLSLWRVGVAMPWTDDEVGIVADLARPLVLYADDRDEPLLLVRVGADVRVHLVP